jgi:hypothetical protein
VLRSLIHLNLRPGCAVCVATGDTRLSANVLLTIGYIRPGTGGTRG